MNINAAKRQLGLELRKEDLAKIDVIR